MTAVDAATDRRSAERHARSVLRDRLRRVSAAAAELAEADLDQRVLLQAVSGLAEDLRAHAGWLRRLVVIDLTDRGLTQERAAALLGVSRQRVTRLLREAAQRGGQPPALALPAAEPGSAGTTTWLQQALVQSAFEHSSHGLALIDPAGAFVHVNPALAELLGRSPAELVGLDYRAYRPADGLGETVRDHVRLRSGQADEVDRSTVWVRADGSHVRVRLRVRPVRVDGDQRVLGFVGEVWPDG